jgi:hypothetical protein
MVESHAVGSDEGVELLKAVSLFVSAFEAQERFSVGRAMLREADAELQRFSQRLPMNLEAEARRVGREELQVIDRTR